jgi:hypothetical protein
VRPERRSPNDLAGEVAGLRIIVKYKEGGVLTPYPGVILRRMRGSGGVRVLFDAGDEQSVNHLDTWSWEPQLPDNTQPCHEKRRRDAASPDAAALPAEGGAALPAGSGKESAAAPSKHQRMRGMAATDAPPSAGDGDGAEESLAAPSSLSGATLSSAADGVSPLRNVSPARRKRRVDARDGPMDRGSAAAEGADKRPSSRQPSANFQDVMAAVCGRRGRS